MPAATTGMLQPSRCLFDLHAPSGADSTRCRSVSAALSSASKLRDEPCGSTFIIEASLASGCCPAGRDQGKKSLSTAACGLAQRRAPDAGSRSRTPHRDRTTMPSGRTTRPVEPRSRPRQDGRCKALHQTAPTRSTLSSATSERRHHRRGRVRALFGRSPRRRTPRAKRPCRAFPSARPPGARSETRFLASASRQVYGRRVGRRRSTVRKRLRASVTSYERTSRRSLAPQRRPLEVLGIPARSCDFSLSPRRRRLIRRGLGLALT